MILIGIALAAVALSAWIYFIGGARFSLFGIDVRATDPYRPLIVALAAFALRMFTGGFGGVRADVLRLRRHLTPRVLAFALAITVTIIGLLNGSGVAGGADSYGYLSQADLWASGNLVREQPDAAKVPWPEGQWTFAPLGYRPAPSRTAIVPMYSPGFPLLLAIAKFVAGHCAVGCVVPLSAGMLIVMTFALGRKAASEHVGLAAAWVMATSPVVLYMVMSPMSDIPAAVFWAFAVYGCLAGSRSGAALGGLAAGVAVLIRPNLAHVGGAIALWLAVHDVRSRREGQWFVRAVLFAVPLAASAVVIALLNQHLYGAVTNSGYGALSGIFSGRFFSRNLVNYTTWLISSQTPIVVLGLIAIWLPWPRLIKAAGDIQGRGLLAVVSMSVFATYLFYMNFDAWWYLRFLLPMWFALCIGIAYVLTGRSGRSFNIVGTIALLALGVYGFGYAQKQGAFDLGRNEQRYIKIAQLVRDTTEPNSVIITLQHSGSLRYYGGRTTLRYEVLGDRWLDRAIAWLHEYGFRPYILLDNPEHQPFKDKFGRRNVAGNLDMAIVLEYRDRYNMSTFLYDPLQPSKLSSVPILVAAAQREPRVCVPPVAVHPLFSLENAKR